MHEKVCGIYCLKNFESFVHICRPKETWANSEGKSRENQVKN